MLVAKTVVFDTLKVQLRKIFLTVESVIFSTRLHSRPLASGVVLTSMDAEMSELLCTEPQSAQ